MPVTGPGEFDWTPTGEATIEIRSLLDDTGLWLASDSDLSGWHPEESHEDMQAPTGAAPGRPVHLAMYPTIVGLCAESAGDVLDLEAGKGEGVLEWWDNARGSVASVTCQLRRVVPSTAQGEQWWPHRRVDVQWFVGRPGLIDWGS